MRLLEWSLPRNVLAGVLCSSIELVLEALTTLAQTLERSGSSAWV
jgi:hypothetical protein